MTRQLNVRSDEAFETARLLANHFGKSTTEIVVEALRAYKAGRFAPSSKVSRERAEADRRVLKSMIEMANRDKPAGMSSDHSYLYDDYGLPK